MRQEKTPPQEPMIIPEGHVRPVFRRGVYRRVLGPGSLAVCVPGIEKLGPLISIRPQIYKLDFTDVYSSDGIPLHIAMTVEYAFDPRTLPREDAADEIVRSEEERRHLVYMQIQRALREVAAWYPAQELHQNPSIAGLERDIYVRIYNFLASRGIVIESAHSLGMLEVLYARTALDELPTQPAQPPQQAEVQPPVSRSPRPEDLPEPIPEPPQPERPEVLRGTGRSRGGPEVREAQPESPGAAASREPSRVEPPARPGPAGPLRPDVLRDRRRRRDMPSGEDAPDEN